MYSKKSGYDLLAKFVCSKQLLFRNVIVVEHILSCM